MKAAAAKKAKAGRRELEGRGRLGAWYSTLRGSFKSLRGPMGIHELRRNAFRTEGISCICMVHHMKSDVHLES